MSKNTGARVLNWLIFVIVLGALGAGGYWYWKVSAAKPPEYKTATVTVGDLIQSVTATGALNPRTNVQVGAQVSGIITNILVDFNSPVKRGELIAVIDPATYLAQVAQAQADLASSKAMLELDEAEAKRSEDLYKSNIVDQSDNETAIATYHSAQATVMMKQAALTQAEANLAYTHIFAPVDGTVISRQVDVGQTVASSFSTPTLFQIANDLAQMQIDALVSEADIGGVETNQSVPFKVDAFPLRTFQGKVYQIRNAPQTNQNVVTYDCVITVDNSDLKLRPGMTANVSIITAESNNVVKIPNAALRYHPQDVVDSKPNPAGQPGGGGPGMGMGDPSGGGGGGGGGAGTGKGRGEHEHRSPTHTIYIVEGRTPEGAAIIKPRQVKTGITDGISTQIVDGLKEGEEVVVSETITSPAQQQSNNPFGGGRRF